MAEVVILVEGYESADSDERSCSTIVLVKDGGMNIVVDPGTAKSQEEISKALGEAGLSADDIDVVFITHSHMDHYRNIGMFRNARSLDYWGWWKGDSWKECDGRVSGSISIIKTPGHSYDGMTMLVETGKGTVAICGDVFWKEGYPKADPYASDPEKLEQSRKTVIEKSDFVVPGHGKMFRSGR